MESFTEETVRKVILENIDRFAAKVAADLKKTRRAKSVIPTKESKEAFVGTYLFVCKEAFRNGGWYKRSKTVSGKVLCGLARSYFQYNPSTIDGDIFRTIYHTYCRVTGTQRNYSSRPYVYRDGTEEVITNK